MEIGTQLVFSPAIKRASHSLFPDKSDHYCDVNMCIDFLLSCTCSLLNVLSAHCNLQLTSLLVVCPDTLYSVGLKTVIAELPRTTQIVATNASRNITGKLVDAISRPVSETTWGYSSQHFTAGWPLFALVGPQPVCLTGNTGHCWWPGAQIWR